MTAVGKSARVTAEIKPNAMGEVMLELRGGTQAYPARASDPKERIVEGTQVWVVEQLGRMLYVTT